MADIDKLVLDSGVILQATLNPLGPANWILQLLDKDEIAVYMSPQTRDEIVSILWRPRIRDKYPHLTDDRANEMLDWLDAKTHLILVSRRYVEYPRDPDDEPVLNLAIHVRADYIVARDKDLLDLNRNRDFRLIYPFIRILTPDNFLEHRPDTP